MRKCNRIEFRGVKYRGGEPVDDGLAAIWTSGSIHNHGGPKMKRFYAPLILALLSVFAACDSKMGGKTEQRVSQSAPASAADRHQPEQSAELHSYAGLSSGASRGDVSAFYEQQKSEP